jgi:hypothetical protein
VAARLTGILDCDDAGKRSCRCPGAGSGAHRANQRRARPTSRSFPSDGMGGRIAPALVPKLDSRTHSPYLRLTPTVNFDTTQTNIETYFESARLLFAL